MLYYWLVTILKDLIIEKETNNIKCNITVMLSSAIVASHMKAGDLSGGRG